MPPHFVSLDGLDFTPRNVDRLVFEVCQGEEFEGDWLNQKQLSFEIFPAVEVGIFENSEKNLAFKCVEVFAHYHNEFIYEVDFQALNLEARVIEAQQGATIGTMQLALIDAKEVLTLWKFPTNLASAYAHLV